MSCSPDDILTILGRTSSGVLIPCYVQPRSSREVVAGVHDGAVKVALTAPPVDGKANEALCRFISKTLHLPKSAVRLTSGMTSRKKLIAADGIDADKAAALLAACN